VALALLLGLHALKRNKWFPAAAALAMLAVSLIAPVGMRLFYQARLETDFGSGLPAVVWKAAERESGASVSREGARVYVGQLREEFEQDYSAYAEQAKQDLADAPEEQLAPAARLLARLSAEWNEPTFASVWSSGAFEPFGQRSNYAERIYESSREGKGLNGYLEHTLTLVYLGALLSFLVLVKKRGTEQMILPLIVLTGALALAGYGANAPEAVRLLPLLCPLAAYGLLSFGLDLSAHLTRPETSWEEARSGRRRRTVK
ncbi:MAG: hypothetical protein ABFC73_03255, partial [Clostridiaceae bacterium]